MIDDRAIKFFRKNLLECKHCGRAFSKDQIKSLKIDFYCSECYCIKLVDFNFRRIKTLYKRDKGDLKN